MATPEEKMAELNRLLDEYEEGLGLPKHENPNGELVKKYLMMRKDELERLAPSECDEMAVVLNSYALYINRAINRQTANYNWAKECLKYGTADKVGNYVGSWQQQEYKVIRENAYFQGLLKLAQAAKQRMDTLSFLSANIKNISDSLENLAKGKRYRNG